MAELKEGWNGPMTLTVKGAAPKGVSQQGEGTQWKGKYPPHKDVLQWDTIFNELGSTKVTVCAGESPAVGTVYEGAFISVEANKNKPEWPFRTMYTKEEKATKDSGGGGRPFGGGGGIKPNLTPEQEIMSLSIGHAISTIAKGVMGGDNSHVDPTFANIDKAANFFYKKISEAKKPEAPQQ